MYQFKLSAVVLIVMVISFSCTKIEVDANSDPQGYADSQIVGQWRITAISSDKVYDWDGNGSHEMDIYSTWSDCSKDNLYEFVGTKTGTYKISCSIIRNGIWDLADRHTLTLIPDGYAPTQELITSLTSNLFHTQSHVTLSNGQEFTISKTWTRQ